MEIGDYIRYKEDGVQKIGKIEKISATLADDALIIEVDNGDVITSDDVLKSDKSILHEIEVGDIIAYEIKTPLETSGILKGITDISNNEMLEKIKKDKNYHIESIVTKQQFEAMKYVVKED